MSFTQYPFAATMQTRTDYAAAMERVYVVYKDARAQCDPLTGHGKNICVAEAMAVEKRAKAAAEVNYRGTIGSKTDSRIADADADLMIARVACGTKAGQEKDACLKEAKATNVRLVANAAAYAK